MTPPANQDDYYAQVKSSGASGNDDKKPLKLKLKAVVKKPTEEEMPKPEEQDISPGDEALPERPKARLVEREHASGGLLRSIMKSGVDDSATKPDEKREKPAGFPKISFAKAEHKVKVLENRPVMQIPDEVPKRRTDSTPGPKRLRDDSKPMFQRDIGFATPSKDGTAKKSRRDK